LPLQIHGSVIYAATPGFKITTNPLKETQVLKVLLFLYENFIKLWKSG